MRPILKTRALILTIFIPPGLYMFSRFRDFLRVPHSLIDLNQCRPVNKLALINLLII